MYLNSSSETCLEPAEFQLALELQPAREAGGEALNAALAARGYRCEVVPPTGCDQVTARVTGLSKQPDGSVRIAEYGLIQIEIPTRAYAVEAGTHDGTRDGAGSETVGGGTYRWRVPAGVILPLVEIQVAPPKARRW